MPLLSTSNLCYVCPSLYSEHILTNESEVYELLVGIDVTKSTGPDEITGHMIQNTAYSITPAVTAIFNQSICEGKFLTEWKKSRITPVPKSYDRSLVENFRPISILCILSKEIECIFHNRLLEKINSDKHWGYSQGKSTVGTLLTTVDN